MTVRSVPRDAQLNDLVQFEVLLPPGSGPGPMVAREHLRLLGLDSAPAYRLYLSLCWLWDHYGTVGGRLIGADVPQRRDRKQPPVQPVKVGGRLVNPAALERYPVLSPDDLATMAYAPADLAADGDLRRQQRQRARKALERIADRRRGAAGNSRRRPGIAASKPQSRSRRQGRTVAPRPLITYPRRHGRRCNSLRSMDGTKRPNGPNVPCPGTGPARGAFG